MEIAWHQQFIGQWFSADRRRRMLQLLEARVGSRVEFPVFESPVFLSQTMRQQLAQFAVEIAQEAVQPANRERADQGLPSVYRVPGATRYPLFLVIDFAIAQDNGTPALKLVELQGFPSLYGYQYEVAYAYMEGYGMPLDSLDVFYIDITDEMYWDMLRQAIVRDHDPKEVALVELHPWEQKTLPDFTALRKHLGIAIVDIVDVIERSGKLYYRDPEGKLVRIRRIMNRAIVDEMESAGVGVPSWWTKEVDVEWAGHPNWYFWMSKSLLPFLRHPAVPRTVFLSDLEEIPEDLSRYVLKPLYAFAGKGVKVNVTPEDIRAIPQQQRSHYVLQEKIAYLPWVPTPYGHNKTEIRVLLLWEEHWKTPKPLIPLVRTGRAPMLGTGYLRGPWEGASTALFPRVSLSVAEDQ